MNPRLVFTFSRVQTPRRFFSSAKGRKGFHANEKIEEAEVLKESENVKPEEEQIPKGKHDPKDYLHTTVGRRAYQTQLRKKHDRLNLILSALALLAVLGYAMPKKETKRRLKELGVEEKELQREIDFTRKEMEPGEEIQKNIWRAVASNAGVVGNEKIRQSIETIIRETLQASKEELDAEEQKKELQEVEK